MKIGFDFHGILDKEPKFFSKVTRKLIDKGHEVHILTGQEDGYHLRRTLADLKINYTHLFSITSFHKKIGTKVTYDENGNPWMDTELWNKTKAEYCKTHNIDIHIDDSDTYGKYFETTYLKLERINGTLYFLPVVLKLFSKVFKLWLDPQKEKI